MTSACAVQYSESPGRPFRGRRASDAKAAQYTRSAARCRRPARGCACPRVESGARRALPCFAGAARNGALMRASVRTRVRGRGRARREACIGRHGLSSTGTRGVPGDARGQAVRGTRGCRGCRSPRRGRGSRPRPPSATRCPDSPIMLAFPCRRWLIRRLHHDDRDATGPQAGEAPAQDRTGFGGGCRE